MKSPKYRVIRILKKTKAEMFGEIEAGDIIQFSVPIERAGSNRGSTYSTNIRVRNISKSADQLAFKTFNQLPSLIEYFELEETEDEV